MTHDLQQKSLADRFEGLLEALRENSIQAYGDRLISLAVFGSVGRRVMRPDSDIDMLLVADPLPKGRLRRVSEFDDVERALAGSLEEARSTGIFTRLSPVFKTPDEVRRGSLLFLDMVDDARILYDRKGFLRQVLDALRDRLVQLGAKRIWRGSAWFWDLKPDFKYGDEFEIWPASGDSP